MSKLTNYSFVVIFDEDRQAGQAQYTMRGGQLPMRAVTPVHSQVTGMYCGDKDLLLIEFKAMPETLTTIDELPKSRFETVRGIEVTGAVRELTQRADEFHDTIKALTQSIWPDLNQDDEDTTPEPEPEQTPAPEPKSRRKGNK
jgi:hypothetical protein